MTTTKTTIQDGSKQTFRNVSTFVLTAVFTGEPGAAKNRKVLIECARRNGYTPENLKKVELYYNIS